MKCPNCGADLNIGNDILFCPYCGSVLPDDRVRINKNYYTENTNRTINKNININKKVHEIKEKRDGNQRVLIIICGIGVLIPLIVAMIMALKSIF